MKCPLCDAIFYVREISIPLQPVAPEAVPVSETEIEASQSSVVAEPAAEDITAEKIAAEVIAAEQDAPGDVIQVEYLTDAALEGSMTAARGRTRGSGIIRHLVGTVLGGAIGLFLGYCILVRIGGDRADFLHARDLLPSFLVGERDTVDIQQPSSQRPTDHPRPAALSYDPPPLADFFPPPGPLGPDDVDSSFDAHDWVDPAVSRPGGPDAPVLPADYLGPRNIRALYTSDDLDQALAAAHAVLGCSHCSSSGRIKQVATEVEEIDGRRIQRTVERLIECPVCHGTPITRITPDIYRQLAELADVVTFINVPAEDSSIWTRKEATIRILQEAGADRDRAKAIGRLAGEWLRNNNRDINGVLLAGTVQELARQGPLYQTKIVLFGNPTVVHVMSQKRTPFQPQDRVLVLGSIIDHPRQQLIGYEGHQPQVIWGGLPVKLVNDAR